MTYSAPPFTIRADVYDIANRWWAVLIRGIAAIIFGIITFAAPKVSLLAMVVIYGAYALVDGVFNLVNAFRGARKGVKQWGWLLFEGLVSIAAGVITLAWPRITALVLLFIIAVWAIVTGIAEIASAIRLRKQIEHEWLMGLCGLLSIVFGVLMLIFPGPGALGLLWAIGAYAIAFGILLAGFSFELRSWRNKHRPERHVPTDTGLPAAT
jgi:uncharacterized membrane protein HdeD (DUF308 family)